MSDATMQQSLLGRLREDSSLLFNTMFNYYRNVHVVRPGYFLNLVAQRGVALSRRWQQFRRTDLGAVFFHLLTLASAAFLTGFIDGMSMYGTWPAQVTLVPVILCWATAVGLCNWMPRGVDGRPNTWGLVIASTSFLLLGASFAGIVAAFQVKMGRVGKVNPMRLRVD